MAHIEKAEYLKVVIDALTYGIAKAENRLTGKSTVISRLATNGLVELLLESFKDFGITFDETDDPIEILNNYIEVLIKSGLLSEDQFIKETNDDNVTITFTKCPYSTACTDLIKDGITEFGCLRGASLWGAMMKSGKRITTQYANDPGNCKVTLQVKN